MFHFKTDFFSCRAGRSKQRRERREYLEMTERPSRIHGLPRGGRKSLINSTHATKTFLLVSDTATQVWSLTKLFFKFIFSLESSHITTMYQIYDQCSTKSAKCWPYQENGLINEDFDLTPQPTCDF